MRDLLSGRFESFAVTSACPAGIMDSAIILLEASADDNIVSQKQLVDLFLTCFQRRAKLLLPAQCSRFLPLLSAAYDVSVAPLRTLVRRITAAQGDTDTDTDTLPLPFTLSVSPSGPLRTLDAAAVLLVTQQRDPLCLLLQPSSSALLEAGATWLGLFGPDRSNGGNRKNTCGGGGGGGGATSSDDSGGGTEGQQTEVLQVAVGVSAGGQVWIHRAAGFLDWRKLAAVVSATLAASSSSSSLSSPPLLVCVLPAADDVIERALLSAHCGFSPPPPPPPSGGSMSEDAGASAGYFDCITFREDIAHSLPLSSEDPSSAPSATPSLLFLLAGQSNMSGRGRGGDLVREAALRDVRAAHPCGCGGAGMLLEDTPSFIVETSSSSSPSSSHKEGEEGGEPQRRVRLSPPYARRVKAFDAKDFAWTEL
jgi:hypothetical protein